eukprot:403366745
MGASLVYLDRPKTQKETISGVGKNHRYACSQMQGWRLNMEDAHICNPDFEKNASIYGVFDGHGGIEVAEFCSKNLEEVLQQQQNYKMKNYDLALQDTFLKIDEILQTPGGKRQLLQIQASYPPQVSPVERALMLAGRQPMSIGNPNDPAESKGCTANVLLIKDNTMFIANAGDARCVMAVTGKAFPLSTDHKPNLIQEKTRILRAGSSISAEGRIDGNLNLSRAIGDLRYKRNKNISPKEQPITAFPDIKQVQLSNNLDFIVIGCDGIWETKTNQQIVDFIYQQKKKKIPLDKICENLLDTLLSPSVERTEGKGCDNMTVIIVDFMSE